MPVVTEIQSFFLDRAVKVTVLLPHHYRESERYSLILFNDGQDFEALRLAETVDALQRQNRLAPCVIAGIHANADRLHEYGTAIQADYAGRGSRAAATTSFIIQELIPFLAQHYQANTTGVTYAGFSLGGLMALDAAWNYPEVFSKTGIFSGSLWWRQKGLDEGYVEADRIMHRQIRETAQAPALQCWFQCGTWDEEDDRDGDGVIDSIQDTLECIAELERKGYRWGKDIHYTEVHEGRHNPETWGKVLPDFLEWASGRQGD